jgi:hypothetical protein
MAKLVRVVNPAAVRHPETGMHVVPDPRVAYRDDDPIVRAYPWMFGSDADVEQEDMPPVIETVSLDGATQTVRRNPSRSRKTA